MLSELFFPLFIFYFSVDIQSTMVVVFVSFLHNRFWDALNGYDFTVVLGNYKFVVFLN